MIYENKLRYSVADRPVVHKTLVFHKPQQWKNNNFLLGKLRWASLSPLPCETAGKLGSTFSGSRNLSEVFKAYQFAGSIFPQFDLPGFDREGGLKFATFALGGKASNELYTTPASINYPSFWGEVSRMLFFFGKVHLFFSCHTFIIFLVKM